jgi:hypothetical protein
MPRDFGDNFKLEVGDTSCSIGIDPKNANFGWG